MAFSTIAKGAAANDGSGTPARSAADIINALIDAANNGQLQGYKNRLINGGFRINQRLAASTADDTYCVDRWYALTQTGAIAATQLFDPETGAANGVLLTQSQAAAQRVGLAQIVESANCRDLRTVITTLAGRVQLSTTDDVCYAVLEHTGTGDAVTSDVVNSWTNTTYTAGQFFIAGVNVLAVGQVSCTAATWRDLTALTATLGATAQNIIVFLWTKNAAAQNVTLGFNRLQWEQGATATKFEHTPFEVELARCQRYYRRIDSTTALYHPFFVGHCTSSTNFRGSLLLSPRMRASPSFSGSAASTFQVQSGAAAVAATVRNIGSSGPDVVELLFDVAGGLTAGDGGQVLANNSSSAYLEFTAEL